MMRSAQPPAVRSSEPPVWPPAWPSADHTVAPAVPIGAPSWVPGGWLPEVSTHGLAESSKVQWPTNAACAGPARARQRPADATSVRTERIGKRLSFDAKGAREKRWFGHIVIRGVLVFMTNDCVAAIVTEGSSKANCRYYAHEHSKHKSLMSRTILHPANVRAHPGTAPKFRAAVGRNAAFM